MLTKCYHRAISLPNMSDEFTQVRLPKKLWNRVVAASLVLGYSGAKTVEEIVETSLDQMEAKAPGVPKAVELYHFHKKQK